MIVLSAERPRSFYTTSCEYRGIQHWQRVQNSTARLVACTRKRERMTPLWWRLWVHVTRPAVQFCALCGHSINVLWRSDMRTLPLFSRVDIKASSNGLQNIRRNSLPDATNITNMMVRRQYLAFSSFSEMFKYTESATCSFLSNFKMAFFLHLS